jgi:hypothetical protein
MLAWILANVIMAPTLTSSVCLARIGMLESLPLLTAKLIQANYLYIGQPSPSRSEASARKM